MDWIKGEPDRGQLLIELTETEWVSGPLGMAEVELLMLTEGTAAL